MRELWYRYNQTCYMQKDTLSKSDVKLLYMQIPSIINNVMSCLVPVIHCDEYCTLMKL